MTGLHPYSIDPSLAGVITAITGIIVGIGGLLLNRQGQRDQHRQQQAATAAVEEKERADRTELALDAVSRRAELAERGEERMRLRIESLEDELDEERSLRRHLFAAQESRCREVVADLTDALVTLRGIVTDEIAQSAATKALRRSAASPHPHELPAPKEDDSEGGT